MRAAEEGRAIADLRKVEVLRVDRIEVDRDRARIAAEAGGVRRIRQDRVGEVLGTAQAADAEVDGRQREVARDADVAEGTEARTDIELTSPTSGHVARGVELDAVISRREDVTAGELGGVAERDQRALAGAEVGDAAVLDEATHARAAVAADVEAAPTLLVDRARARHRTRQRRIVVDREVPIPGHREVTELGDVARATGDRQVGRAKGTAKDEILEEHRLIGHAEINAGGTGVISFVIKDRIPAEAERRRRDRLKRANDQVVRLVGRDEFESLRAVPVVAGVEGRIVQRDGRVIAQHVVPTLGALEDLVAAGKRPACDLAIGRLVPLDEMESARSGLDDRARTAVGDDVARQGEARHGGGTELVTHTQGGDGLREVGRSRDGHTEHLLGIAAAREGDPGRVDREVVDDRGGASGRTVDDRRHVRRAEVVEGGDGEVVSLARTELLGVETGHDFDGDRVTEGKDAARERDGAGAEAQRVVDEESTADRAVRETRLDLAADVGGLDIAGVDGRATGVGVGADFIADGERRGDRGRAQARLHEGDGARAIADDAGEDLTSLAVVRIEGQRARRSVVVRDEARARQAAEGETEAVEVQGASIVDLEVDAGVGGAAARGDGARPGEAQRAFLDEEGAEDRSTRDRHRHHIGGTAEDEVARARLDEVSRDEVGVDGRGRASLPFPHEDIGVRRVEGQGRGRAAEAERAAAGDDRSGRASAVHDEAAADETEGVCRVGQREITAELETILFDEARDCGGRRGLAEIRLTRDARTGRGGGVGVEDGTGFGDGGERRQVRDDADAGARRNTRTGDQHTWDEARGAEDADRVARQRGGEAVQGDRRGETIARLGGGGGGGEGADRQRARADGGDGRTSRDIRARDDHAGGKTRDIGEGDRVGSNGGSHLRQLDLRRVGGTDAGGASSSGSAEGEAGGAVNRQNRGARSDVRADNHHTHGQSSGAGDSGRSGTIRDEAADRLRQRDIGDRGGGKAVGGGVVREGDVAARRGGADDDARGINDAARTSGGRSCGRQKLLGVRALAEISQGTREDCQRALRVGDLANRRDGELVSDSRRGRSDRDVTAAAVGQTAGGGENLGDSRAVGQAEEAAVDDEGASGADERVPGKVGGRDRVEAVVDRRARRDPRIVTADRQAGIRRDAGEKRKSVGGPSLDRIHHESAEASLGEIEGTRKAFGRDRAAGSRQGLVEAAQVEGVALGDVQEAVRREDVLVVRGERAVDRERATVEVDEGRTRRGPTSRSGRSAEHAAGARGRIEGETQRSVLGDDEAARVDLPGSAK